MRYTLIFIIYNLDNNPINEYDSRLSKKCELAWLKRLDEISWAIKIDIKE